MAQHDNNTTLAQSKLENSREGFRVKRLFLFHSLNLLRKPTLIGYIFRLRINDQFALRCFGEFKGQQKSFPLEILSTFLTLFSLYF